MLQPCRFYDGEVESYFCEECLVPSSAMAIAVGPHTGHRHRRLLDGLESYPIRLWRDECEEYSTVVDRFLRNANARMDAQSRRLVDAQQEVTRLDAAIAELQQRRAAAVDTVAELASPRGPAAEVVAATYRDTEKLLLVGRGRLLHTLRHSLGPVIDGLPAFTGVAQELRRLERRVVGDMCRAVDGAAEACRFDEVSDASGLVGDLATRYAVAVGGADPMPVAAAFATLRSTVTAPEPASPEGQQRGPAAEPHGDAIPASIDMSLSATAALGGDGFPGAGGREQRLAQLHDELDAVLARPAAAAAVPPSLRRGAPHSIRAGHTPAAAHAEAMLNFSTEGEALVADALLSHRQNPVVQDPLTTTAVACGVAPGVSRARLHLHPHGDVCHYVAEDSALDRPPTPPPRPSRETVPVTVEDTAEAMAAHMIREFHRLRDEVKVAAARRQVADQAALLTSIATAAGASAAAQKREALAAAARERSPEAERLTAWRDATAAVAASGNPSAALALRAAHISAARDAEPIRDAFFAAAPK